MSRPRHLQQFILREDAGKVLMAHRLAAKLSLVQLAELAGLSNPCISRIETKRRDGRIETFEKLATALGVDLAVFLTDTADESVDVAS